MGLHPGSTSYSPQCWLSSRVLGLTTGPTWVLFTVLLSALPWGQEDTHSNHCILWTDFTLVPPSPLSLEALGWGSMGASVCHQGLLAPCWLRGQGLAVGFSLKYRGYCLSSISEVKCSIFILATFVTVGWLQGVALSLGSQALAGDTQAPSRLGPYLALCLLSSAVCTGGASGNLVTVSSTLPLQAQDFLEWRSWRAEV